MLAQAANRRLAVVIPITLLLIFGMLFVSFGSLRDSILVLLNIPLALVGGLVALLLTGQSLSVPASVGFIALFGVAVLNGLVLVNAMHITASVFINDDEPGLHRDYKRWLEELAPFERKAEVPVVDARLLFDVGFVGLAGNSFDDVPGQGDAVVIAEEMADLVIGK